VGAFTPTGAVTGHVVVLFVCLVLLITEAHFCSTMALLVDMASSYLALEETLPARALRDMVAEVVMTVFRSVGVGVKRTLHDMDKGDTTRVDRCWYRGGV
jgi:hypothetical protein